MAKINPVPSAPEVPIAGELPADARDPRDARIAALEAELEATTKRVVDAVEANEPLHQRLAEFEDLLAFAQTRINAIGTARDNDHARRTARALEISALLDLHRTAVHGGGVVGRFHAAALVLGAELADEVLDAVGPSDAG